MADLEAKEVTAKADRKALGAKRREVMDEVVGAIDKVKNSLSPELRGDLGVWKRVLGDVAAFVEDPVKVYKQSALAELGGASKAEHKALDERMREKRMLDAMTDEEYEAYRKDQNAKRGAMGRQRARRQALGTAAGKKYGNMDPRTGRPRKPRQN